MRSTVFICALAFIAGSSARADEFITYTLSGFFTGTLTNGNTVTPLSAQGFSIALTADLNDVENNISNSNFFTPFEPSVAFTLDGLGTGTYTDNIQLTGANGSSTLSFSDQSGNTIAMTSPGFTSYDLQSLLNLSGVTVSTNLGSFVTTLGTLTLPTNGSFTNGTFTATETPEPSSLFLAGMCFAGLIPMCLSKRRAALRERAPVR